MDRYESVLRAAHMTKSVTSAPACWCWSSLYLDGCSATEHFLAHEVVPRSFHRQCNLLSCWSHAVPSGECDPADLYPGERRMRVKKDSGETLQVQCMPIHSTRARRASSSDRQRRQALLTPFHHSVTLALPTTHCPPATPTRPAHRRRRSPRPPIFLSSFLALPRTFRPRIASTLPLLPRTKAEDPLLGPAFIPLRRLLCRNHLHCHSNTGTRTPAHLRTLAPTATFSEPRNLQNPADAARSHFRVSRVPSHPSFT